MTKTREVMAQRARIRRSIAKKLAQQRLNAHRLHIAEMLTQVKSIVADPGFVQLLAKQNIDSVPRCIAEGEFVFSDEMTDGEIADCVLKFVVAWKFLFPMLGSPKIAEYLERSWPGFILDLKDTFINLVMDGPFPGERRTPVRPTHFS